jgi:hypothetical protein
MMLTPEEQERLNILIAEKQMAGEIVNQQNPMVPGGLTPDEQERLRQLQEEKKLAEAIYGQEQKDATNKFLENPEADLGITTRALHSIEPLQSNRIALLEREFGKENVLQDDEGNVFVMQEGVPRPVNAPGISIADVADVAGSLPETAGALAAGTVGAFATGGPGGVPATLAGGAAGSIARQATSAMLGVPQVAEAGERAVETGLSGLLAVGGQFVSSKAKGFVKDITRKLFPSKGFAKAGRVITKRNLGKATLGQQIGPESTVGDLEKVVAEVPLIGRKYRKEFQRQADNVARELKVDFGDFQDPKFSIADVGEAIKQKAGAKIAFLHDSSSALFDETINEVGDKVTIPGKKLEGAIRGLGIKMRLLDKAGNLKPHDAKSGLDAEDFKTMQGAFSSVLRSIRGTIDEGGDILMGQGRQYNDISVKEMDTIRKTITSMLAKEKRKGTYATSKLKDFETRLLRLTQEGLDAQDKGAAEKFKAARHGWKAYKDAKATAKKIGVDPTGKQVGSDVLPGNVFKNLDSLKNFTNATDRETVKEAAKTFLAKQIRDKSEENFIRPTKVLNILKEREDVFKRVFGDQKYSDMIELLEFDKNLKIPVNPSRTFTTKMKTTVEGFLMGLGQRGLLEFLSGAVELPAGVLKGTIRVSPTSQKLKRKAAISVREDKKTSRQKAVEGY